VDFAIPAIGSKSEWEKHPGSWLKPSLIFDSLWIPNLPQNGSYIKFANLKSNVVNAKDCCHFGQYATRSQWGSSCSLGTRNCDEKHRDFNLPLLDEPIPPSQGKYGKDHTRAWSAKIDSFDSYIFVTAEYNHGIPGALKNAIDFLFKEWNNKAAGFVSYGSAGGVRGVEQLRLVMAELKVATVRAQVTLSLFTDLKILEHSSRLPIKKNWSMPCSITPL
jgi:NAD(P)H-dependent FMN reductase